MSDTIYIIVGATASGKTNVSIEVAKQIDAQIISADSVQVYKHLNIGSAKPTKAEMQGIKHFLVDEIELDAPLFSVSQYQKRAFNAIEEIYNDKHLPLIVGGTGLYINSLIYPLEFTDAQYDEDMRKNLQEKEEQQKGVLFEELIKIDPDYAYRIHVNDVKRTIRALEVFYNTGKTMTQYTQENAKKKPLYDSKIVGIDMPRELIYQRIEQRVDLMINHGLVEEVEGILKMGYSSDANSLQGLGYKEIIAALEGKMTMDEAIDKVKLETRHFAKRQLTWFRRNKDIVWIDGTQKVEEMTKNICDCWGFEYK